METRWPPYLILISGDQMIVKIIWDIETFMLQPLKNLWITPSGEQKWNYVVAFLKKKPFFIQDLYNLTTTKKERGIYCIVLFSVKRQVEVLGNVIKQQPQKITIYELCPDCDFSKIEYVSKFDLYPRLLAHGVCPRFILKHIGCTFKDHRKWIFKQAANNLNPLMVTYDLQHPPSSLYVWGNFQDARMMIINVTYFSFFRRKKNIFSSLLCWLNRCGAVPGVKG